MIIGGEPEKPDLEQMALYHYGVKGMKWGIIRERDQSSGGRRGGKKKDDSGGSNKKSESKSSSSSAKKAAHKNALDKKYMAVPNGKKKSVEEAKRSLAENHKKSAAKLEKNDKHSDRQNGGLTKGQKRALKWGIVAGGVAGLVVLNKIGYAKAIKPMKELAGKRIPAETFSNHVQHSKVQTWGFGNYIQKQSYDRPEFELPVGHTFHRLSQHPENGFGAKGTYSVHSKEDLDRYIAAFRQEKGANQNSLHHISWTAEKPVKVPSLSTALESMREAMSKDLGREVSAAEAKKKYEFLSGGGWHPEHDKHVGSFFENLKSKGYGAIVDEMDAGVIGETPLVVIDSSLMSAKTAKPLTAEAIKTAEESLIELTNRKL